MLVLVSDEERKKDHIFRIYSKLVFAQRTKIVIRIRNAWFVAALENSRGRPLSDLHIAVSGNLLKWNLTLLNKVITGLQLF